MEIRLDRDRPLWEVWVIEGLTDNRWAMLTKVHHCRADGIAATHMLAGLCDDGIGDSFAGHLHAANAPKTHGPQRDGFSVNPLMVASGLWNTSVTIAGAAARAAQGAVELAVGLLRPAPPSTLNGPVSSLRRYSAARVALDDIAKERRTFDVTINDVALDAITESYTKSHGQRQAGHAFVSVANRIPFPVTAWGAGVDTAAAARRGDLATNVPGPRHPLHIMGRRVLSVLPIPPIAMNLRTGVAILSYAEELVFGILADYDTVPDPDALARGIEVTVARLAACSRRREATHGPRRLSLVETA